MSLEQHADIANRWVDAINRQDQSEDFFSLYHPDAIHWTSSDNAEHRLDVIRAMRQAELQIIQGMQLKDVRHQPTPNGFVVQANMHGVLASGEELCVPLCIVCRIEGTQIIRQDGYVTSRALDTAFDGKMPANIGKGKEERRQ